MLLSWLPAVMYRAAGELGSTLNKLYGPNLKIQTTMSKSTFSYSHADLSSILILIGGPFHNSVTREFLAKIGTSWPFRFEEDASLVYTGSSEKEKFTPKVIDDKY